MLRCVAFRTIQRPLVATTTLLAERHASSSSSPSSSTSTASAPAAAANNAYAPPPPPPGSSSTATGGARGIHRGTRSRAGGMHKFSDNTADAAAYVGNDEVPDYNSGRHLAYLAWHGRRMWLPLMLGVGYLSVAPALLTTPALKGAYATAAVLLQRLAVRGRTNHVRKDLRGFTCVVTGGTSGIGLYTALQLVNMGASVIIASKPGKEAETLAFLRANYQNWVPSEASATPVADAANGGSATPPASAGADAVESRVSFVALDYNNQIQVAGAVARIKQLTGGHLDLLVNCAAVWTETPGVTAQGFEEHIGVNFLGPFHLTEALLPALRRAPHRSGRIVYVTCEAHNGVRTANVVEERMTLKPTPDAQQLTARCYSASKLGNIYHAQSLARRRYEGIPLNRPSEQRPVDVCIVDPGFCATGLQLTRMTTVEVVKTAATDATTEATPQTITVQRKQKPVLGTSMLGRTLRSLWVKDALEGSQSVVHCCVRDSVENGQYYAECQAMPSGLSRRALDAKARESVVQWAMSKTMDKYYEMKRK